MLLFTLLISTVVSIVFAKPGRLIFRSGKGGTPTRYFESAGNGLYRVTTNVSNAATFNIPGNDHLFSEIDVINPVNGTNDKLGIASEIPAAYHYARYGKGLFRAYLADMPATAPGHKPMEHFLTADKSVRQVASAIWRVEANLGVRSLIANWIDTYKIHTFDPVFYLDQDGYVAASNIEYISETSETLRGLWNAIHALYERGELNLDQLCSLRNHTRYPVLAKDIGYLEFEYLDSSASRHTGRTKVAI